ncbi:MAG TPA: imidazole glycerol phosphate synthase subunit HisH [Rhizomicrobium sp.]|jgi:glutamine amidotransferase|nr:imidazole glycerol phosphate synthase subunit HisH [Rhizomicrobium sp.]
MTATVAIVDYGSGNLRSVQKALERVTAENATGQSVVVTADSDVVANAERIVLPGVGAFADCMNGLNGVPGMVDTLRDAVLKRGAPFLGICVGMQLLADVGHEFGDHDGLGWIGGEVVKITPSEPALKVPHMGWNELNIVRPHALLARIPAKGHAYFVHSYHLRAKNPDDVLATTDYAQTLTAMVGRDNIAGTQFHPEKSQAVGLALLGNFLRWRP